MSKMGVIGESFGDAMATAGNGAPKFAGFSLTRPAEETSRADLAPTTTVFTLICGCNFGGSAPGEPEKGDEFRPRSCFCGLKFGAVQRTKAAAAAAAAPSLSMPIEAGVASRNLACRVAARPSTGGNSLLISAG